MELPLVLIHGYPFDHTMWFSTIAALGAQAKVICPDLPGFGKEPVLESEPSMGAYADWLAELLKENKAAKAVVAGMSMGGYVALAFAQKYGNRLAGLGLISTQSAPDAAEVRTAREEMVRKIQSNGPSAAVQAILPRMFSEARAHSPELTQYPKEGAEKAGVAGLKWALQAMAGRPDRTALVKRLEMPVLVIHGTADKIVPFAKARELAEACKTPILFELSGVGHASPLEAPDQVAQGLGKLMAKVRETVSSSPK